MAVLNSSRERPMTSQSRQEALRPPLCALELVIGMGTRPSWKLSAHAGAAGGVSISGKASAAPIQSEPVSEDEFFRRTVLDTKSRTAAAIPLYVVVWLAIASSGGLWETAPRWVMLNLVGLLAVTALRVAAQHWTIRSVDRAPRAANFVLCAAVLANGLYWGGLTALSLVQPWGTEVWWGMLAMAYALAAAGSSVMAINPLLRYCFPAAVLLPLAYGALVEATDRNVRIAGAIPFFFFYSVLASRAAYKDYREALTARMSAEAQAITFEKLSSTDALTGVANRLAFDATLEREWSKASKTGETLSLLMIDLDHFKRVNDTYGHPFGDRCLQEAARALERSVRRGGDTVFRYGGEEFAVLLSETDIDGAARTATRCLENVRAVVLLNEKEEVALTCSIGIALQAPRPDSDRAALVQAADGALYKAKREGRNRVCFSEASIASVVC